MTYIELFDDFAIKNICSSLAQMPDKVVFIGTDKKKMQKAVEVYKKILDDKVEYDFRTAPPHCLSAIVDAIESVIEEEDECVFDITGGGELYLVALGVLWDRYINRDDDKKVNLQMHRFNILNGKYYDCDGDGATVFDDTDESKGHKFNNIHPYLTVLQNANIYGGTIKSIDTPIAMETFSDTNKIWEMCKQDPRLWNASISFVSKYAIKTRTNDENPFYFSFIYDDTELEKAQDAHPILKYLYQVGILNQYEHDVEEKKIEIEFANQYVYDCFNLAGKVLETKIYYLATQVVKADGYAFDDVQVGVELDWDGFVTGENTDAINEVDLILMDGMVPIFISCKNGQVNSEELYKLNSVANKFGGSLACKILITNEIYGMDYSTGRVKNSDTYKEAIRNRAAEMGIYIFENTNEASDEEIMKALAKYRRSYDFKK